jgi:hypothetical protein
MAHTLAFVFVLKESVRRVLEKLSLVKPLKYKALKAGLVFDPPWIGV